MTKDRDPHVASERVLIPPSGIGTLALDGETFRSALAEGARLAAAIAPTPADTAPELMTAEEMEAATGVPASWFRRLPRSGHR